jgi:hypothetical protein
MSKASAVPVEPQEQTNLLEESILAPGVIGGTVPGGKSSSSPSRQAVADRLLFFPSYPSLPTSFHHVDGEKTMSRVSEGKECNK